MDQHRVDTIKAFGDRVARHIAEQDSRFWDRFNHAKYYHNLRYCIVRANRGEEKAGRPPLIDFDDFITIFEYGEEDARHDWGLARDLILIRVTEKLHEADWFTKNPDALEVTPPDPSETSNSDEIDADAM